MNRDVCLVWAEWCCPMRDEDLVWASPASVDRGGSEWRHQPITGQHLMWDVTDGPIRGRHHMWDARAGPMRVEDHVWDEWCHQWEHISTLSQMPRHPIIAFPGHTCGYNPHQHRLHFMKTWNMFGMILRVQSNQSTGQQTITNEFLKQLVSRNVPRNDGKIMISKLCWAWRQPCVFYLWFIHGWIFVIKHICCSGWCDEIALMSAIK